MDASIGRKLARLRVDRGLALDVVARRARVEPDRLHAFEHGTPSISTAAAARIATALDVSLEELDDPIAIGDVRTFFFQNGKPDFFHHDLAALADGLRRARDYRKVVSWLGVTPRLSGAFAPEPTSAPAYVQGYELARRVRRALGNEADIIPDVKRLLEDDLGVLVELHGFQSSKVRALTAKARSTGEDVAAVFLAAPIPPDRRITARVDLAHELAHVLFDAAEHATDVWIELTDEQPQPWEQRARAFAAELLVPLAALEARYGSAGERDASFEAAVALARQVQGELVASRDVVVNHLVNHGYVATHYREALLDEVPHVASATERFTESALVRRLHEAVDVGAVTRARALELLGLSVYDDLPA